MFVYSGVEKGIVDLDGGGDAVQERRREIESMEISPGCGCFGLLFLQQAFSVDVVCTAFRDDPSQL
jgi:hypothetical protein